MPVLRERGVKKEDAIVELEKFECVLPTAAHARPNYTSAPITVPERVMLDYVMKLTKDATKVWKNDHDGLRAVGFDDRAILQITLIASWFNYINRVADALGVGRE